MTDRTRHRWYGAALTIAAICLLGAGSGSPRLVDALRNLIDREMVTLKVDTVAAMSALTEPFLKDGQLVETAGYTAALDGGGNTYRWDDDSAATVDGGFVIDGPGADGRFLAIDQTVYHALQWGCTPYDTDPGSGWTMSTAQIDAMVTAAETSDGPDRIYFPPKLYFIDAAIEIDNAHSLELCGEGATGTRVANDLGRGLVSSIIQTAEDHCFVVRNQSATERTRVTFRKLKLGGRDSGVTNICKTGIHVNDRDGNYLGNLKVIECQIQDNHLGISNRDIYASGSGDQIDTSSTTVTLEGGDSWPTWAATADLHVNGEIINVASRDSATQLTLSSAPVAGDQTNQTNFYLLRDSGIGIGYATIRDCQMHGNAKWAIRLSGQPNGVRIVDNEIRGNGGSSDPSATEANYKLTTDLWGGGIWLADGHAAVISGNVLESNPTAIRLEDMHGFDVRGNYGETNFTAFANIQDCVGGQVVSNWGSTVSENSDIVYVYNSKHITVKDNASGTATTQSNRFRLIVGRVMDLDANLAAATFDQSYDYFADGTASISSSLGHAMKFPWTTPKSVPAYSNPTTSNATYDETLEDPGPYGDFRHVYVLRASADNGFVYINPGVGDITPAVGDYYGPSFWVKIPTANVASTIRMRYYDSQTSSDLNVNLAVEVTKGEWTLVRVMRKSTAGAAVSHVFNIQVPNSGDRIFIHSPQMAVYSQFPYHPQPVVATVTGRFTRDSAGQVWHGLAAPTRGAWTIGDVVRHTDAASSNPAFFQCTTTGAFAADWAISTAYKVGQRVKNDTNKIYKCVTAGTSAGSGGPTGTGTAIADDTAAWDYVSPLAVFTDGPALP